MVICFWKATESYGSFSNWYKVTIKLDGRSYCCCEQYMMYQKAILFGDIETAEKILATNVPAEIKDLGRQVKNFDSAVWDANKEVIVGTAVMAKFVQNPYLYTRLMNTKDAILAEASPYDTVWGIGYPAEDHRSTSPAYWRGENLLGQILMQVRKLLRVGVTEYQPIEK